MRRLVDLGPAGREALSDDERGKAFLLGAEISELLFASEIALAREHLARSVRIAEIFSGPDFASAEGKCSSNRPRNTLFELTIAACIERAGLRAEFGDLTDVKTVFRDIPVSIEAKRPQTFGKAESNIRHAAKQLAKRTSNPRGLHVVAMCIGKMLTNGTHMLTAETKEAMKARLNKEADDFFAATRRHWEKKEHVDGLLVRISVAGVIAKEYRQYHAAPMTLFTRPGLSNDRAYLLKDLSRALESGLPGQPLDKLGMP